MRVAHSAELLYWESYLSHVQRAAPFPPSPSPPSDPGKENLAPDSWHQTLCTVLPVAALMPELVVAMSDVHQQARIKVIQSISSLIAKHKEHGGLDSHKESLKTIIISALNDLSADSRQKGKAVYATVKEMWPVTAKEILEQVKDKVREQLDGSGDNQGNKDDAKKSIKPAGPSNRIDFKALREAQRKKVKYSDPYVAAACRFLGHRAVDLFWLGGLPVNPSRKLLTLLWFADSPTQMLEAKAGKADSDVIVCAPRAPAMPKQTEEAENECKVPFAGGKSLARTPAKTPGKSLATKTPGKTPGKVKAALESMNA